MPTFKAGILIYIESISLSLLIDHSAVRMRPFNPVTADFGFFGLLLLGIRSDHYTVIR